jgi:hypothetical protein
VGVARDAVGQEMDAAGIAYLMQIRQKTRLGSISDWRFPHHPVGEGCCRRFRAGLLQVTQ